MYTSTYKYSSINIYTSTYIFTHSYIYNYTYIDINIHMHIYTRICMNTYPNIYIYICLLYSPLSPLSLISILKHPSQWTLSWGYVGCDGVGKPNERTQD